MSTPSSLDEGGTSGPPPPAEAMREQVHRIASSRSFGKADRLTRFLRFIVAAELEGRGDELKEYLIGTEVFGRRDYDPAIDSAVRVEASKLRARLEQYYGNEGQKDAVRIEIPKGAYVPVYRTLPPSAPPETPPDPPKVVGTVAPRSTLALGRRRAMAGAAVAVVTAGGLWMLSRQAKPRAEEVASLAVLPLANLSGDPEQEYFADGMTEALISDLARIQSVRVISRTSVARFKDARKPLSEIARELNVDHVIEGSVVHAGKRVRISAKLIRVRDERSVWANNYERDVEDVLALQSEVAGAIAREVRGQLSTSEPARPSRPVNEEAYDAYLRGRYLLARRTPDGIKSSRDLFEKALERDPSFARAWAGLADAYILLASYDVIPSPEAYPRARAAAEKALKMDPDLAEAHTSLAALLADYYWDWEGSEKSFRQALSLSPSYALAHQWYSELHTRLGHTQQAIAEMRQAQALDPLSLIIHASLGIAYYRARQFGPAVDHLRQTAELDANFVVVPYSLGLAYSAIGRHAEAIRELKRHQELMGDTPDSRAMLAYGYCRAGRKTEARRMLGELLQSRERGQYLNSVQVAAVYTGRERTRKL